MDVSPVTCCCAGLGCFRQKIAGSEPSIAFLNAGGTIVYKVLHEQETITVDTTSIVAMEETVQMGIVPNGRCCTMAFGGECCFSTTLTGPGKVFLQVRLRRIVLWRCGCFSLSHTYTHTHTLSFFLLTEHEFLQIPTSCATNGGGRKGSRWSEYEWSQQFVRNESDENDCNRREALMRCILNKLQIIYTLVTSFWRHKVVIIVLTLLLQFHQYRRRQFFPISICGYKSKRWNDGIGRNLNIRCNNNGIFENDAFSQCHMIADMTTTANGGRVRLDVPTDPSMRSDRHRNNFLGAS